MEITFVNKDKKVSTVKYDTLTGLLKSETGLLGTVATYTHNGFSYGFQYDVFGNSTGNAIAGNQVVFYDYRTQGDIRTFKYTYEKDDLPTTSIYPSGDRTTITYDGRVGRRRQHTVQPPGSRISIPILTMTEEISEPSLIKMERSKRIRTIPKAS